VDDQRLRSAACILGWLTFNFLLSLLRCYYHPKLFELTVTLHFLIVQLCSYDLSPSNFAIIMLRVYLLYQSIVVFGVT
jgi:hypothetical protein